MLYLLFVVMVAGNALAADTDSLSRLTSRFKLLENRVQDLEHQVASQQHEIIDQKASLAEKSREITELLELLKEKDTLKKTNRRMSDIPEQNVPAQLLRRFVLDKDDVAFYARLDETELTGVSLNQTILFDNVVLNAGNAYNINSGQFITPVDGFYLLSVAVTSDLGHNHQLQVALMKNDVILARAHAHGDSGHLDQGGITIVVGLSAGDKVFVKSTYQDVTDFYGGGLTTFSGFHIMFK
ncbi:heavy metal-binding protein HIP-like [Mercenaria mercenaria]|uniref:heavy metal-binding protein HIP-like n=1 Tax=Mercenaria mercenaria TaxID=6596 RepID=UPI001E1D8C1F|nr:heavy metal-binding protein HIP-like [Mercenaria mercenaria]